jgi:molybdopterin synthase sulfur carrier subunit
MAVKVRIPQPLQKLTRGKEQVDILAKDIKGLIEGLEQDFPGIKERICDDSGRIRRFINIYVNEEDVRFLNGDATGLKDGDEVSVVPAIAGGSK